jgi:hypothetical protein
MDDRKSRAGKRYERRHISANLAGAPRALVKQAALRPVPARSKSDLPLLVRGELKQVVRGELKQAVRGEFR